MAPGVGLPPAFNLIQSRSSVSLNVDITLADLAPLLLRNISCSFASVLAQTSSTNRSRLHSQGDNLGLLKGSSGKWVSYGILRERNKQKLSRPESRERNEES